ncbi:MAG: rod shape-determining protein MreD [Lachnospiraceae bacterium]|nr:rod shape-determining protein MreD [Lachnospiraceae bacterium]
MKRILMTAITILLCLLLQTTIFQKIAFAGEVPNLILIVVVAFAYMRGCREGMYIGFASGLLIDLMYGDLVGMNACFYLLVGYFVGVANEIYYSDELSVPIILVGISDFLFNFVFYIINFMLRGRIAVATYVLDTILPETVYTVLLACIIYKPLHSLNYRLEQAEDTEEVL